MNAIKQKILTIVIFCFFLGSIPALAQPVVSLTNKKDACDSSPNGRIDITASSGIAPITLFILGPTNFLNIPLTVGVPFTASGLPAGTYFVIVQDGSHIDYNNSFSIVTITPDLNLALDPAPPNPKDNASCSSPNGSIAIDVTGGTGSYSFLWTGPAGTYSPVSQNIATLAGGNYNVTVSDNGSVCTRTFGAPITIHDPSPLVFTVTPSTQAVCSGNAAVVNLSGSEPLPVKYQLYIDGVAFGGLVNGTGSALVFTIPSGNFSNGSVVKIQAQNGLCTPIFMPTTSTITVNTPPTSATLTLTGASTICAGQSTTLGITVVAGTGPYLVDITGLGTNIPYTSGNITVSPVTSTTYTLTKLTDVNGCLAQTVGGSILVNVNPKPTAVISGGGTVCASAALPSVTFTFTGTAPFNFKYSAGGPTITVNNYASTVFTIANAPAGTYSMVSLVDNGGSGCTATSLGTPVTVTVNPTPTFSTSVTNETCFGGTTGSIKVTPTSGTAPYTYSDDGGTTFPGSGATFTFTSLAANSYPILIKDANGCPSVVTPVVVSQPTAIVINTTTNTNLSCFGATNGTIHVTASGGTGTLTYTLTPGAISNTTGAFTALGAGSYTVSVTDVNACGPTVTGTITITTPPAIVINTSASTNISCFGGSNGTITIGASGGTGTLTYKLTPGGSTNTTGTFAGLNIGSYTVSVTDANACGPVVSGSISITAPAAIAINTTASTNVSCSGGTNGTITVGASGGTGTLTYTLSPGAVSNTTGAFTNLGVGSYTVSVTDVNSCGPKVSGAILITGPPAIAINTTTHTNVSCSGGNNGTITVGASGGTGTLTYTLNPGAVSNTTGAYSNLGAGSYTVSVTDANACGPVVTGSIVISSPSGIVINTTTSTNISCFGGNNGTITIGASGGTGLLTYTLSPGAVSNTSGSFTNLGIGTYTVSVTDANGCAPVVTGSINITAPTAISITTTSNTNLTCSGGTNGTINVTANGGTGTLTYTLTPGAVSNTTGAFVGLGAGSYTVSVTDANLCGPVVSGIINVTAPAAITINSSASKNITCFGLTDGTITIGASGGTGVLTYTLNPGAVSNSTGVFAGLSGGTYTVSITDANNCGPVVTGSINVATPPIAINSTTSTNITCNGSANGSIIVSATGGTGALTYTLSPGAVTNTSGTFTGLDVGSYTVSVTDLNNCGPVTTGSISITQPATLAIVSTSKSDATCLGLNDGLIQVTSVTGGVGPYKYSTDNGATFQPSNTFPNLAPATYNLIVKDANSCTTPVAPITVNAGTVITPSASTTNASCAGASDGTITVGTVTGGTAPYTYSDDGGASFQVSNTFSGKGVGSYSIVVQDNGGCQSSVVPVTVSSSLVITFLATPVNATCNGLNDGSIAISGETGGVIPYTYSNDGGTTFQASATFTGLAPTTYNLIIKDANGCMSTTSVTTVGSGITVTINTVNHTDATCGSSDGTIDVGVVSGGTSPYTFSIDGGLSFHASSSFASLPPASYSVVAKDINGCTSLVTPVTVSSPPSCSSMGCGTFTVTYVDTLPSCALQDDGSITFTVSGGTPGYIVTLSSTGGFAQSLPGPGPNFSFTNLSPADYSYTVLDALGNTCTLPFSLHLQTNVIATASNFGNANCFGSGGSATITVVSGGTSPYEYSTDSGLSWVSFTSPVTITNLPPSPTPYAILIRDDPSDLCVYQDTVTISGPATSLDTLYVKRTISEPDLASGTMLIGIQPSGEPPYDVKLILTTPLPTFPNETYVLDWTPAALNTQDLNIEYDAKNLYAGAYTLSIRDSLGCEKDYSISIKVDNNIFIPNIFTPNGDGINDSFYIRNNPTGTYVEITNRWGKEVYHSSDYKNDWGAGNVSDGIYYYRIKASGQVYTGWVEVLRNQ